MNDLILLGGGGHCRSAIDVIEQEARFNIVGIVDAKEKVGSKVFNYEVIGSDNDLPLLSKTYNYALVTVGHIYDNSIRVMLFEKVQTLGFTSPVIVSPMAYVSRHAKIGDGTIVMHQSLVNAGANIGNNCILNTKSLIEHDATIGNHTHVSTAATVNGGTIVGEHSFIGSNSTTKEYTKINGFNKAGRTLK